MLEPLTTSGVGSAAPFVALAVAIWTRKWSPGRDAAGERGDTAGSAGGAAVLDAEPVDRDGAGRGVVELDEVGVVGGAAVAAGAEDLADDEAGAGGIGRRGAGGGGQAGDGDAEAEGRDESLPGCGHELPPRQRWMEPRGRARGEGAGSAGPLAGSCYFLTTRR